MTVATTRAGLLKGQLTDNARDYLYDTALGLPISLDVIDRDFILGRGTNADLYSVRAYGGTGDGVTNDRAALQNAIEAANTAGGGTVFVPEGIFLCTTGLTLYSNVSLLGMGRGSVIKANGNVILVAITGKTNVVLENLTLDGNLTTQQANSHLVAITTSSANVSVRNCWLLNSRYSGIYAADSSKLMFEGNTIDEAATHGIDVVGNCTDLLIRGNLITDSAQTGGGGGASGKGIGIGDTGGACERVTVANNVIKNCIQVHIELTGTKWGTVTGNVIERTAATSGMIAISLGGALYCSVTGNTVHGGLYGIEVASSCTHVTVAGNTLDTPANIGVSVTTSCTHVVVSSNIVRTPGSHGIQVYSSCTDVTVTSNIVETATGVGVYINGGDGSIKNQRFIVTNNIIRTCTLSGIYVLNSDPGVVTGNILSGNNSSATVGDADLAMNVSGGGTSAQKIHVAGNRLATTAFTQAPTDSQPDALLVFGGFKKLAAQAVGTGATTLAHGLPHIPSKVLITPLGNATVWMSAAADATNVTLRASGATTADVYVA